MDKDDRHPKKGQRPDDTLKGDAENIDLAHPSETDLPLPHERDESAHPGEEGEPADKGPRQVIEQAASDLERGLRDTERRGIPSDVPTPGTKPENTPGADVPPEGVDRKNYSERQKAKPQSGS